MSYIRATEEQKKFRNEKKEEINKIAEEIENCDMDAIRDIGKLEIDLAVAIKENDLKYTDGIDLMYDLQRLTQKIADTCKLKKIE